MHDSKILKNIFDPLNYLIQTNPPKTTSLRNLRILLKGEVLTLNKTKGEIYWNNTQIAEFREVERVQIRTITDSNNDTSYRLSKVLTDERKISAAHFVDYGAIMETAKEWADKLAVSAGRKKKNPARTAGFIL